GPLALEDEARGRCVGRSADGAGALEGEVVDRLTVRLGEPGEHRAAGPEAGRRRGGGVRSKPRGVRPGEARTDAEAGGRVAGGPAPARERGADRVGPAVGHAVERVDD